MVKIQIIMAVTLDEFLPRKEEVLMLWVRKNTQYCYPYWQEEVVCQISPLYGVMVLMDMARRNNDDCIYLATVHDEKCGIHLRTFSIQLGERNGALPASPLLGKDIPLTANFHFHCWRLRSCKSFSNGICRLIYGRKP